jgi:DNA-binding NarL/FixJ family response regulator
MIRVLLVDDHPLFRKGLLKLLATEKDIEVVGEASDGHEALTKARELMPDIILMDIKMPRCDGLEATRLINEECPYIKIVMLTVSDDDEDLFQALKSGARGYLLKTLEPEDLYRMIRDVFDGEAAMSPTMATKILKELSGAKAREPKKSPGSRITEREKEVLQLVTEGAGNKEIAARLFISESTVRNHLHNILEKLHLHNRVQAAIYALQEEGILRREP